MRRRYILSLAVMLLAGCDRWSAPIPQEQQSRQKQDEALYASWLKHPRNAADLAALNSYLSKHGVATVVPINQLVRSDVNWRRCNAPPFLVPPKTHWPHLVPTLALLRDEVVPRWGPVEALSVYRSPQINECLGGASRSKHMAFHALDLRFVKPVPRAELVTRLCGLHRRTGAKKSIGLGIYKGDRFHLDTSGFRLWGADQRRATSPCLDVAT